MPLPSSGSISMSQINTELGRSSTANISLDTAENGGYGAINTCGSPHPSASNPASMSEWRGYNHTAQCCPANGTYLGSQCGTCLDGDTMITMADGTLKRIADILQNEVVVSWDIDGMPDESPNKEHLLVEITDLNYTVKTAVVKDKIVTSADHFYSFNNGLLISTESHEHWVNRDGVWRIILAKDIVVGDNFLHQDGSFVPITSIDHVQETRSFYNINVEDLDMYVANCIVTHNAKTNTCNTYFIYANGSCGTYLVDQGYTPAACGCIVYVYIDVYVPSSAVCWSAYNFAAYSGVTVNTNVTVTHTWYGDLGGFMSGSVTIPQGTNCNSGGFSQVSVSCWGENYSSSVTNINPTASGAQEYVEGNINTSGLYPC